jgi:hypothetical protein
LKRRAKQRINLPSLKDAERCSSMLGRNPPREVRAKHGVGLSQQLSIESGRDVTHCPRARIEAATRALDSMKCMAKGKFTLGQGSSNQVFQQMAAHEFGRTTGRMTPEQENSRKFQWLAT